MKNHVPKNDYHIEYATHCHLNFNDFGNREQLRQVQCISAKS